MALGLGALTVGVDEQAANSKLRQRPVTKAPTTGKGEEKNNLCWLLKGIFLNFINDIHLGIKRRKIWLIIKMISLNYKN
ncbi:hypothetical protein, partial [Nostoc edaphicum]|uniref:hypothetical protein n=1 Tax=Nostoc edaphicum TaxID=264686 RepID=UPI002AD25BE5